MPPDDSDLRRLREYLTLLARAHFDKRLQAKCSPSDIVQDTLVDILRDWTAQQGRSPQEHAAWLRRVLLNNLLDYQRRFLNQRRNVAIERSLNQAMEQSSAALAAIVFDRKAETPLDRVVREEGLLEVARVLSELPHIQYEFIVRHHLERQTISDIADETGHSVSAIAGQIRRGLAEVRRRLSSSSRG